MNAKKVLAFEKPNLISEWDFEKNSLICAPDEISIWSKTKVWWICKSCGYNWQASISNRVSRGSGCPKCAGKVVIKGVNDFQSNYPALCEEWNYSKNNVNPDEISTGSNKKVWWKCHKCGYEWQVAIEHRVNGSGCPYCAGKALWRGHNDLETLSPKAAKEWNYEKNDKLPSDYQNGSSKKVWWKGSCGHSWDAKISDRAIKKYGCPYCSGARILKGFNDLATLDPELAKEWDYEKNTISPESVSPNSHKRVFWKCVNGHVWEAQIKSRHSGTGCPVCFELRRKRKKGGYSNADVEQLTLLSYIDIKKEEH